MKRKKNSIRHVRLLHGPRSYNVTMQRACIVVDKSIGYSAHLYSRFSRPRYDCLLCVRGVHGPKFYSWSQSRAPWL